ncbi:DNA/RNA non-specific endonuclease domain-containing protein, related [Eimeria praecox]|uniref:DNA/RNA non-specific endonuclease domain-containing protein, related n=1 Tax=Eimeria praecox TaxID=51316 RepID=U6G4D1_9EIME|nr:DNA/RNA non-specific endonuclease domain-containing protein, related [Eimeria praecox]
MWPQPGSRSPTTYHRLMLPPNSVPFRLKTFSSSVSPLLKQPEVVVEHFRDPLVASTTSSRSPPSPPYHRREHSADGAAADAAEKENEQSAVSDSKDDGISAGEKKENEQSAVSDSKDDGISAGESEKYERLTDLWRPEPFDLISTGPPVPLEIPLLHLMLVQQQGRQLNAIENIVNASKRYFSDVLVYTGPVWFPVDASSSLPLVYGHSQPQEEDAESGARKIYACVRPWEGATVGLPVSVEALDGSPFVPPLGRRFLKEFPGKEQQRKETEDSPWILMPSPLKEALERCRWRLSPAVEKPGLSPALRIEYEVFGFQLTPVPTHFFKLILAVNPKVHPSGRIRIPGPPKRFYYPPFLAPPAAVGAFLLPNTAIFDRTRPIDFRVPLAFLEYVTGIDFTVVTDVIAGAEANSPYHLGPSKIPQVSPTYLPGGSPSAPFHQEEGPLFDRETALLRPLRLTQTLVIAWCATALAAVFLPSPA